MLHKTLDVNNTTFPQLKAGDMYHVFLHINVYNPNIFII